LDETRSHLYNQPSPWAKFLMTQTIRIDAHIHYTPPALAADLAQFIEQEPYWGLLLSGERSIQGWASPEQMLADMDRAGLDRVLIQGEYRQKHEMCVNRNNQALALVKRWPERVMAFATIQPKAGEKALDELARCIDEGLCGLGELNPYAQGYTLGDPDFLRVVEFCVNHNLPLNLHANEEVGPYYPGKSSTPLRHYYELACRYPELKLILAHWGGGLFFYEIMPRVRQELTNVWYDTAASPLLYPTAQIFKLALQAIDHRKILYGSDYPLRLYPRRQAEPDFAPFIAEIDSLGLAEEVYADIMGGNAARLLGLGDFEKIAEEGVSSTVVPKVSEPPSVAITGFMAVPLVAATWPATQAIFEGYGIPWQDTPVPAWEPILQAAAAHGWGPHDQQRLLEALNAAVGERAAGG
jgi:predicted TIM-barrel fold metal-dependent hydrolase